MYDVQSIRQANPIEEVVARAGVDLQVSSIRPTVACPALGRAAVPPEPAGGAG